MADHLRPSNRAHRYRAEAAPDVDVPRVPSDSCIYYSVVSYNTPIPIGPGGVPSIIVHGRYSTAPDGDAERALDTISEAYAAAGIPLDVWRCSPDEPFVVGKSNAMMLDEAACAAHIREAMERSSGAASKRRDDFDARVNEATARPHDEVRVALEARAEADETLRTEVDAALRIDDTNSHAIKRYEDTVLDLGEEELPLTDASAELSIAEHARVEASSGDARTEALDKIYDARRRAATVALRTLLAEGVSPAELLDAVRGSGFEDLRAVKEQLDLDPETVAALQASIDALDASREAFAEDADEPSEPAADSRQKKEIAETAETMRSLRTLRRKEKRARREKRNHRKAARAQATAVRSRRGMELPSLRLRPRSQRFLALSIIADGTGKHAERNFQPVVILHNLHETAEEAEQYIRAHVSDEAVGYSNTFVVDLDKQGPVGVITIDPAADLSAVKQGHANAMVQDQMNKATERHARAAGFKDMLARNGVRKPVAETVVDERGVHRNYDRIMDVSVRGARLEGDALEIAGMDARMAARGGAAAAHEEDGFVLASRGAETKLSREVRELRGQF